MRQSVKMKQYLSQKVRDKSLLTSQKWLTVAIWLSWTIVEDFFWMTFMDDYNGLSLTRDSSLQRGQSIMISKLVTYRQTDIARCSVAIATEMILMHLKVPFLVFHQKLRPTKMKLFEIRCELLLCQLRFRFNQFDYHKNDLHWFVPASLDQAGSVDMQAKKLRTRVNIIIIATLNQ